MNEIPSLKGALTSFESALAALLNGLAPIAPACLPLSEALGCVAAEMPPLRDALPPRSTAVIDGWAFRALDLAGASSYSPVALTTAPIWVEAGEAIPDGCDCVLEADLVDRKAPVAQVFAEAIPGNGICRVGEDVAAKRPPVIPGRRLSALDLLVLRSAGFDTVAVRAPHLRVIDVATADGEPVTTRFVVENAMAAGAVVSGIESVGRDAGSIARALDAEPCDLVLLIGGTGTGRTDATAEALATRGALFAHDIALQPGRTTAIGRSGDMPVVALPGAADQAFAAFLALVQPVLDRLSGRSQRTGTILPLARKISSTVGIAELVLLKRERTAWMPLAVGRLPLDQMRLADAWLAVPGDSEGYGAGIAVEALPLRDFT